MVEPMAVSFAGKVALKLLEQVMEATKTAINCNKCCKALHALLEELQPIVDHAVREVSQSDFDNAFKRPRIAAHDWLNELEGTLNRAAVEVNKCIEQQSDLNPWSRFNTGKRIQDVTESVKKLLQQAGVVGLAVTLSESSRAQKMEKMMQEQHEMMEDLRATALRIEFATFTRESLQEDPTRSSAQGVTSAIKSGLCYLLQCLSLRPGDNMLRLDTGASSSSSCPRAQIVNEDAHNLTYVQEVPQHVFGLDNFTMRLQQSITSSSIDAERRYVGVWGMGGAGKTLLAQIAYNSREVREHFGGKLVWLTVSHTPNIKSLYDSCWRQLGLRPINFAQLEEYRTGLFNEFQRRRVFLVLDDVWSKEVLEQLDLAKGRGSVTLVTTRNQHVLKKAGVIDEDELKVGVLSKEDSWKLFCVHAFPRRFSNIPFELQGVAELVADECKGLPLALKVIGGSMVGKTMPLEWELQLNCLQESRQLQNQQEEEALFGCLKLSFDNLDNDNPISKECFLGFAAFPEDHMVKMGELIELWEAQGLLNNPTKKLGDDPAQAAYYLVGLLIGRSLIEVARDIESYACKVHDVMRDLAFHILEGQRPITCLYRPGKKLVEFPRDWILTYEKQPCEVCKLSLMYNDLTSLKGVTFSAPKLQVLLLASNYRLEAMPKQYLKGIQNIKFLDLSRCVYLKSLPSEIGNLRQLTHLHMQSCQKFKSFPKAIGKLTQLTHLLLTNCSKLKSLPEEIGKLTQLIHLDLSSCRSLKELPKSIGYLRNLQRLDLLQCNSLQELPKSIGYLQNLQLLHLTKCYHAFSSDQFSENRQVLIQTHLSEWSEPCKFGPPFALDICKLTTLTNLHISGQTYETVKLCDQQLKAVSKLEKLKSFHIYDFYKLEMLPDAFQSMVNLEELWIIYSVPIKTLPAFITSFSKLRVLRLDGLYSLESLPTLNTLKMLLILSITECKLIKKLPDSFTSAGAFPSLKEFDCSSSGLVELSKVENGAMPMLQILNLDGTDIKNLPITLVYLKNLKVVYIPEERFDNLCKQFENTRLSEKFSSFFRS
jgi:Leucine-rich repeat (LRR) protein